MFLQAAARGAYAYDEAGRRYVDYVMAYGPLLFGHTHPALVDRLGRARRRRLRLGATHPEEVRLAERIRGHLPSMERMRFVTTGTEAMMSAVRVARASPGARVILKFAGNYHGHFDLALLDAGASAGARAQRNPGRRHARRRRRALQRSRVRRRASIGGRARPRGDRRRADRRATWASCPRLPGFLEGLRERARRWGALLDLRRGHHLAALRAARRARTRWDRAGSHGAGQDHGRRLRSRPSAGAKT